MSPELTYQKFLLKINRNNTQGDIVCDKARAVLLINEAKNRWVERHLKNKDSILIDSLRETIKTVEFTTKLVGKDKGDYVEFPLEDDLYEDILAKSECKKGSCKGIVYSREVKNQNKNLWEWDENQRPDFDFEWTFHSIQAKVLRVYKTNFKILKTILEYYKVIPDFDVQGYTDINNNPSKDISLDLSDQYIDQILSLAATEFQRDFDNPQGVQIGKDRTRNEE